MDISREPESNSDSAHRGYTEQRKLIQLNTVTMGTETKPDSSEDWDKSQRKTLFLKLYIHFKDELPDTNTSKRKKTTPIQKPVTSKAVHSKSSQSTNV